MIIGHGNCYYRSSTFYFFKDSLRAGGEGDNRGWDGWMASATQWTWVWGDFGSWWWIGRSGVLRFMGSQSWTWLSNWTDIYIYSFLVWAILKVFIEFLAALLLFYVLCFWLQGMGDLSSLTRDWTCTPCIGRQSLNWTAREVPYMGF